MKWILLLLGFMIVDCNVDRVKGTITDTSTTVNVAEARFEFPEGVVTDPIDIVIEKRGFAKKRYDQGYELTGVSYTIKPPQILFEKPVMVSISVKNKDIVFAARIANGFVPLANSYIEKDTLKVTIWHGGEYYLAKKPGHNGIIGHSDIDSALLIVTDPYISDYVKKFSANLIRNGYDRPVWTFIYDISKSIGDNALLLRDELIELHGQYGDFRLDAVSFGLGGLVLHRYAADTALYQRDISSAVIAVGTPFKGANFAIIDTVKKSKSPYRFFFIDALGDLIEDITPGSEIVKWIKENPNIGGRYSYADESENKNFASIRGKKTFPGELKEEKEGDGLISLESTMLTALEPEPFLLDHFDLFEDNAVHKIITDFVLLYRGFNWPGVFKKIWNGQVDLSVVTTIWEKENKLNYRDRSFDVLLEWNQNMLNSVPENGILITNGDNDTYPAWYLQSKGVRNDVLIVNRSLFNIKDYVIYLQKNGLPLTLSESELEKITPLKKGDKVVWISDQLLALLFKQKERPLVISTTVYSPERFDVPLCLAGVVYEINDDGVKVFDKYVNIAKTRELFFNVYSYDNYESASPDLIGEDIGYMYMNYVGSLYSTAMALKEDKKYDDAIEMIKYARKFVPARAPYHPLLDVGEADIHIENGNPKAVDSLFDRVLNSGNADISTKKVIAMRYSELGNKEKAIRILADCLKDNPDNKEIIDLIKRFQEEL